MEPLTVKKNVNEIAVLFTQWDEYVALADFNAVAHKQRPLLGLTLTR